MKVRFSFLTSVLLLLAAVCFEAPADLTLQQMRDKLETATLISGLDIRKEEITKADWTKNSFVFQRGSGKNEFLLLDQFDSTCGTTSAEMVLHYYGQDVGQKEIWEYGTVHIIDVGATPWEIKDALDRLGVPAKWYHRATLNHLKSWVQADRPPILLLRFGLFLHYVVVVGYNAEGDFLLADPNGAFRWMSSADLAFGWSLNAPGLDNEDYEVRNAFEKFGLRLLTPAVDVITGGENVIIPESPPNPSNHFPPNYTPVLFYKDARHTYISSGRTVEGGDRFNPTWSRDRWEETFTFVEDIADYRVSGVVPAKFENLGGLEPAYIEGHTQVDSRTVKVWGQITPGEFTRGQIFVFVRGYKEPLYGVETESSTQSHRFYSNRGPSLNWERSWQSFTFPGDVVGYTISAGIDFEDRFGAELIEHYKTGNEVEFRIGLRKHILESNGITVNVTAHYEPVVAGRFTVETSGDLSDIPSGENRTVTVTVYTQDGYAMPGVTVEFIDTDDSEIAFSPTAATTNSSGVATSTLKTGSHGDADFEIEVDDRLSKRYSVSVARTLKEHTEEAWFSSNQAPCKVRFFGKCAVRESPEWYTAEEYIDVPSWVSIDSYSLSTYVPFEDRLTEPYVRDHWRDGNRVHLEIRFREHWVESNEIQVIVHAKYWGTSAAPGAPLKPEVRPDPEPVATVWEDLSVVPSQTALLPNYPNPFNPETWLPYHLAEAAEVTLRIYSAEGRLVRTLALGHHAAGVYENKSRAAYWDGRNSVGEPVASGLYFYTLTAGDFTETRKMLIVK